MSNNQIENEKMRIIYDGDCPFCNNYIKLLRLRKNVSASVELINAREHEDIKSSYKKNGYDLNDGMAVEYDGRVYYGADAIHFLGIMSSGDNLFSFLNKWIFRSKRLSLILYPILKFGRAITLKILGRQPL